MGLNARNPVFGISDGVRLKPSCSATQNSFNIGTVPEASSDILPSIKQITKVLISLRGCTRWSYLTFVIRIQQSLVFSRCGTIRILMADKKIEAKRGGGGGGGGEGGGGCAVNT